MKSYLKVNEEVGYWLEESLQTTGNMDSYLGTGEVKHNELAMQFK